jgi:spore germination protein KB
MLEKGKISPRQAGELLFMTILAAVILFVRSFMAEKAGHDAWLAALAGSFYGLLPLALAVWLARRHPGLTIFQYSETILGRLFGKLAGLAYVWFFLHWGAVMIRKYGEYLSAAFMPATPLSVFNFSLVLLAAWAVVAGLEAIARMNEFVTFLVATSLLGILALSVPKWELAFLQPVLAEGFGPVLQAALIPASRQGEVITLAVLLPYLTRPHRAFASGAAAVLASGAIFTFSIVGVLAVFGPDLTATLRFTLHYYVHTINIADFLTRFEAVVMAIWVAGVFIKTTVMYYCAALGLGQVLGLAGYRPVVLPLGVIMATLSVTLFANVAELAAFLSNVWPVYSITIFTLGLPLLLLAGSYLRGRTENNKPPEKNKRM